jgi:CRP-like cAMP-binding protein
VHGLAASSLEDIVRSLGSDAEIRRYGRGTVLLMQGEVPRRVWLVEEGTVRLAHTTEDGREVLVGVPGRGCLVGAAAAFLDRPLTTGAFTTTAAVLWEIPVGPFRERLEQPSLARAVLGLLCIEVLEAEWLRLALGMPARDRLEIFLRACVEREGGVPLGARAMRLQMPIAFAEVARVLALTPETVSRVLRQLEDEHRIQRLRHGLMLTDPEYFLNRNLASLQDRGALAGGGMALGNQRPD